MNKNIILLDGDLALFVKKLSKRLNRGTRSIQVTRKGELKAALMNRDRFYAASYSGRGNARRRVYKKTLRDLHEMSKSVEIPERYEDDEIYELFGSAQYFEPFQLLKGTHTKTCTLISPMQFRMFKKAAFIRSEFSKTQAFLIGMPTVNHPDEPVKKVNEADPWK